MKKLPDIVWSRIFDKKRVKDYSAWKCGFPNHVPQTVQHRTTVAQIGNRPSVGLHRVRFVAMPCGAARCLAFSLASKPMLMYAACCGTAAHRGANDATPRKATQRNACGVNKRVRCRVPLPISLIDLFIFPDQVHDLRRFVFFKFWF